MAAIFQELTCNLSKSKKVRRETYDGRKYLVAPAVLLTHGVHKSANDIAVYYPDTELSNMPSRWDHKPIVCYHPTKNGKPVTACDPNVLESRGCGFFLNTNYDDKLRTELWFDEEKTKKVDKRIITALESETMMEISTGLYMDIELTPGEFNGKKYDGKACNFAPDHVAILPDKVGACSIKDGGGMLQINETAELLPALIDNDASYSRISSAISSAMNSAMGYYCYVRDVYDGFFIYSGTKEDGLYKKSYTVDKDGKVTLGSDATPVKWVTEYRTMGGTFVGNSNFKEISVEKKTWIDFLVANDCGWEEKDRSILEGLPDDKLKGLHDKAKTTKELIVNAAKPPVVPVPEVKPPVVPVTQPVVAAVETPRQITVNELPPEIQELVAAGQAVKAEVVKGILAANNNTFTEAYLNAQPNDVLRGLAKLAGVGQTVTPSAYYGGQATTMQVQNTGYVQEPLGNVDWNFKK